MKYAYECVAVTVQEVFTFELDEPLSRGDLFTRAGHVYEVLETPPDSVTATMRVGVRRLL